MDLPNDRSLFKSGGPDDIDNVRMNEGRGRFFVEAKIVPGGSLLLLKGKNMRFMGEVGVMRERISVLPFYRSMFRFVVCISLPAPANLYLPHVYALF